MMKLVAVTFLVAVGSAAVGCASPVEDPESASAEPSKEQETSATGTTAEALRVGGGLTGTGGSCTARNTCYTQCSVDYPNDVGRLDACRQLCDSTISCVVAKVGIALY